MAKHWREAASVIVTAKSIFPKKGYIPKNVCPSVSYKIDSPSKNAVDTNNEPDGGMSNVSNFKVLALKRSSHMSYMPDSYVFPGGNVDHADSSKEWLALFEECGIEKSDLEPVTKSKKSNAIEIFENNKDDDILRAISLRITGIRETFEESGVLLCKSKNAGKLNLQSKWASYFSGFEVQNWQKKVQDNANEFLNLCKHFECFPDIWSLQEWSNWLSPRHFPKRFNSVFFVVTLSQMPPIFCSGGEINEFKWSTPQQLVDSCNKQEIVLPPPQYYELSRLMNFDDIEDVSEFAINQNKKRCELWMPFRLKTPDGEVTLLQGDDLYPESLDYNPSPIEKVEKSIEELRKESHKLHRMEHTKEYDTKLLIRNLTPSTTAHILPKVTAS